MSARTLIVRLGAMGDIIHALPAAASLKQSFPQTYLAWAVETRWLPLLEGNPFIDELIPVNRRELKALVALRRKLRSYRFTTVIDFQGLIKSALIASAARPEKIYGFAYGEVREKPAALIYSHKVKTHARHVVDRNLELAQQAGATNVSRSAWLPEGSAEGELPSGPFVLANPLAGWASKQWPLENYAALARKLLAVGVRLVLNAAEPLQVRNTVPHASGIAGLIDATRRAAAVIGVDSGPLHIAAALNKPGVAIYGPTDPARNGPYGGSITVLRAPSAETTYKRNDTISESMKAIEVDQVFEALQKRLHNASILVP